jgi:TonB family protein
MRSLVLSILILGVVVHSGGGQTVVTTATPEPSAAPSAEPSGTPIIFRPALMSSGEHGLINKIDRLKVAEENPREQGVMFYCVVNKNGKVISSATYRETNDSAALEREIRRNIETSLFIPAIYDSKTVDAIYYGTATFSAGEGQPRLRIFQNNDTSEVDAESDFVGPQPVYGGASKFLGLHYPKKADHKTNGIVDLDLQVDAEGNIKDIKLAYEYPTGQGFGEAALADFTDAKFVPAFRKGDPVECSIRLPVYYQAPGR